MNNTEHLPQTIHVYRMSLRRRAAAMILLSFGLIVWISIWGNAIFGTRDVGILELLFPPAFAFFGAYWTASAFKSKVILAGDRVEVRGLLSHRALPLEAVRGRREEIVRGVRASTRYLKLVPSDDRLNTLTFEESFAFDDSFHTWFDNLPDLDAMDRQAHKDSDFGLV